MEPKDLSQRQSAHVFYTWTAQKGAKGLEIVRAEGSEFWTSDGMRWIDFESQVYNTNLGHGHPGIRAALHAQIDSLPAAQPAAVFESKAALGEALHQITPPDITKFFLALGGAEANENAIKLARLYTGRHKIVSRYMSYHGATYGALSLTGDPRRLPYEPGISGVVHTPPPYCYRCPWGQDPSSCHFECVDHLARQVEMEGPENVAAIIVEPISGAAGGFIPPVEYMQGLRKLCDAHGILLIADEVLTGFGRTGAWFAFEHYGIVPDMMTMAKGITGGYAPLGVLGVHERIARHFDENKLWAGLTCYGHPLACAAGVAAIEAYEKEGLIERAASMEGKLMKHLQGLYERHEVVDGIRAKGLYGVFELVADRTTREPLVEWNASGDALRSVQAFKEAAAQRGLHVPIMGQRVVIAPPLNIPESVLDEGMARLDEALRVSFGKGD